MRGGLSPSSGLMCVIVNSVGQGNFTFAGKSQGISETPGCGNHVGKPSQLPWGKILNCVMFAFLERTVLGKSMGNIVIFTCRFNLCKLV